mgnify:CR=1 FL=1
MFIIGYRTLQSLMAALVFQCAFCRYQTVSKLYRRRTWFTFFFIPVFPISGRRHIMFCSHCGSTSPLDDASAERYVADAHAQQAAHQPAPHASA